MNRATAMRPSACAISLLPILVSTLDGEASNTFYVDITAPQPVTIAISPTATTVRVNRTRQFTATVQNSSNTSVIWKVNGVTGGNNLVGTISLSGLYRAPSTVPKPALVSVSATAAADPTQKASASVTISRK